MELAQRSLLIVLTGWPGTGKLTVARAIAAALEERGDSVRVVDNHWVNNPIFGIIENDGVTPLPSAAWERVTEVARSVYRTLEELTPRSWHVVMTVYLDGETDTGWLPHIECVATKRGALFVPVRLLADPAEIERRIVAQERRERMKSVDPEEPHRLAAKGPPYDSGHPHGLDLDITEVPPEEAARTILEHAATLL